VGSLKDKKSRKLSLTSKLTAAVSGASVLHMPALRPTSLAVSQEWKISESIMWYKYSYILS
jgi:hypothetical protein